MTNTKILGITIAIALILIASPIAMQSASAGGVGTACSTDKNNPTTGTHGLVFIANIGDDCYLGEYGTSTIVNIIMLSGGGKVFVVNTQAEDALIENTSEKVKFKDNNVRDDQTLIRNNVVTMLEVMNNDGSVIIKVKNNQADILKVIGNVDTVRLDNNVVNDFAICKNNLDLIAFLNSNTYDGKNKGCPINP